MERSVLVFVSHASEDKECYIEPIVRDLEECYIRVWIDRKMLIPGQNLRKSILRDGLDKTDVALIFFTPNALQSSWVDREIKHVLRDERNKGNDFDLRKLISIFDSNDTYERIKDRYPELTDDLLHLMPPDYGKIQLGQLVAAIWSKYLSLQGGEIETQRQILAKDKEIFQKEKEIHELTLELKRAKDSNSELKNFDEFQRIFDSGKITNLIATKNSVFEVGGAAKTKGFPNLQEAYAFGLVENTPTNDYQITQLTEKGKDFFKWVLLNKEHEK